MVLIILLIAVIAILVIILICEVESRLKFSFSLTRHFGIIHPDPTYCVKKPWQFLADIGEALGIGTYIGPLPTSAGIGNFLTAAHVALAFIPSNPVLWDVLAFKIWLRDRGLITLHQPGDVPISTDIGGHITITETGSIRTMFYYGTTGVKDPTGFNISAWYPSFSNCKFQNGDGGFIFPQKFTAQKIICPANFVSRFTQRYNPEAPADGYDEEVALFDQSIVRCSLSGASSKLAPANLITPLAPPTTTQLDTYLNTAGNPINIYGWSGTVAKRVRARAINPVTNQLDMGNNFVEYGSYTQGGDSGGAVTVILPLPSSSTLGKAPGEYLVAIHVYHYVGESAYGVKVYNDRQTDLLYMSTFAFN